MTVVLAYPVGSPTTTVTLRSAFAVLAPPQATLLQTVHIAQGGHAFIFAPSDPPVVTRLLPLELRWLHEANDGVYHGWAAVLTFVLTTLAGAKEPCRLTDADGAAYTVRYVRGLESITEVQHGRFSGTLTFREEV